jgi:hypothetical protein
VRRFHHVPAQDKTGSSSPAQHGSVWRDMYGKENTMPLIQIIFALIVVGVLLWLVNRFIPMADTIKKILNSVVVIAVVLWLLNVSGLLHSISRIRVG